MMLVWRTVAKISCDFEREVLIFTGQPAAEQVESPLFEFESFPVIKHLLPWLPFQESIIHFMFKFAQCTLIRSALLKHLDSRCIDMAEIFLYCAFFIVDAN